MSNKPKIRPPDEEYILNHREMSERQLAAALNLSKTTVHRARKRLGLTEAAPPPAPRAEPCEGGGDEPEERVVRLERHARRLEAEMANAPAAAFAALSKEYRATLEEIDALKAPKRQAAPAEPERKTMFNALRTGRPPARAAAAD